MGHTRPGEQRVTIDLSSFPGVLTALLILVGGAATLRRGISWIATEWSHRVRQSRDHTHDHSITETQHSQQREIEQLRSTLKDRQDLFAAAVSVGSATHRVAHERSVKAVEHAWTTFLGAKKKIYWELISLQVNIPLAQSNEDRERRAGWFQAKERGGWMTIAKPIHDAFAELEIHRPFLGERLWSLLFVYDLFLGYAITSIDPNVVKSSDGPSVLAWHEQDDEARAYLSVLKEIVPSIDENAILARKGNGFRQVLDLIEREVIAEIHRLLSGTAATQTQIEDARHLAEFYAKIPIPLNLESGPSTHVAQGGLANPTRQRG
jgi:hypothetical protein